jgi:hypothetical protein
LIDLDRKSCPASCEAAFRWVPGAFPNGGPRRSADKLAPANFVGLLTYFIYQFVFVIFNR